MEDRERALDDPTGGPSVQSKTADQRDDAVDVSAGAGGQDAGKGAVEETREDTDSNPNPG